MEIMGIISWIILGGLAGWIASKITGNNASMGIGTNIVVGIIGAFIGGWVVSIFGGTGITGFNVWSLLIAVLGAVILLAIINVLFGDRKKYRANT